MIRDATVEVTCDAKGCTASALVGLPARRGGYLLDERQVYDEIEQMGWLVTGDGHFCSRACAGEEPP